ncbi:MAG: phage tail assembly protein [Oscillospiraceae bacterium]|nr:phage tail assembly protein [Oscillospiraceae bacterium]
MERYTLKKPITHDGETITEIDFDLDSLSALDLERAERDARKLLAKKETMNVPETNKKYQACVAAKASGHTVGFIRSLGGKDYTQVCLLVMNFLLDGDSEDEEEESESEAKPKKSNGETPTSMTKTCNKPLT